MFCLYIRGKIDPTKKERFQKIAKDLVEATRKEEGCLHYAIGMEKDNQVAWNECWKDEAALEYHKSMDYFNKSEEDMAGFFSDIEVYRMEAFD